MAALQLSQPVAVGVAGAAAPIGLTAAGSAPTAPAFTHASRSATSASPSSRFGRHLQVACSPDRLDQHAGRRIAGNNDRAILAALHDARIRIQTQPALCRFVVAGEAIVVEDIRHSRRVKLGRRRSGGVSPDAATLPVLMIATPSVAANALPDS